MNEKQEQSRHAQYGILADKVGGRFQLTALLQKRLRELNRGAKPCVLIDSDDHWDIALEEIRVGAIELEAGIDMMASLRSKAAKTKKAEEKKSL